MKTDYYPKSISFKSFLLGILLLSSVPMSVHAQSLTVISPNGGEVWTYGQTEIISWSGSTLSNMVRIDFSYDGGTNWWYFGEVPSGPNGGSASLGVPNVQTTNAILKMTDVANPEATDMSDGAFTVYVPPIVVFEPSASSAVFAQSNVYVNWTLTVFDFPYLNAELSIDNGMTYTLIAQNIDAHAGGYTYLYLSDTPADSCILKLYNSQDPSEFGMSEVFTISPLPVYNLVSPTAGELLNTYSPYTITWTVEDPYSEYCFLEYSLNNGQTWELIGNGMNSGNSGSYPWFTPNVESEECLIRITDSFALNSTDISEMFTIFTFPETPVCMVTVDSLNGFNTVVWEKPATGMITDFLVYRETDEANVYEVIDTVSYESVSVSIDPNSNPAIRPYRYKLGYIDTLSRIFPASDYHQTIHLTISQGVGDAWNLIWTAYLGFDYPSCRILRKTDEGAYEQIATVSSSFNSYTDLNAPPGYVSYIVEVVSPGGCDPAASRDSGYGSVYSNIASNSIVSVSENTDPDFTVYPIPADRQLNVSFGENITGQVRLTLTDLTGRVVLSEDFNDMRPGQVEAINSSNLTEGIYLLQLISGENMTTKKIAIRR